MYSILWYCGVHTMDLIRTERDLVKGLMVSIGLT